MDFVWIFVGFFNELSSQFIGNSLNFPRYKKFKNMENHLKFIEFSTLKKFKNMENYLKMLGKIHVSCNSSLKNPRKSLRFHAWIALNYRAKIHVDFSMPFQIVFHVFHLTGRVIKTKH